MKTIQKKQEIVEKNSLRVLSKCIDAGNMMDFIVNKCLICRKKDNPTNKMNCCCCCMNH